MFWSILAKICKTQNEVYWYRFLLGILSKKGVMRKMLELLEVTDQQLKNCIGSFIIFFLLKLLFLHTWLVLWENRPLWGWKERFTHSWVTMIVPWASSQAYIIWLPNEFLLLLTPNMHTFFNISTNGGSFQYAKITLFFNPEEGDFLTTRVTYRCTNFLQYFVNSSCLSLCIIL